MTFSIIIPTYNRAAFLPKAIESVLAQTYTDWELIIVDDGSTDNTKEVISQYSDGRIIYIYQQNAERSAARNNGINHAKGDYVCFLDSDDEYLNNYLSDLLGIITSKEDKRLFIISSMAVENNGEEKIVQPNKLTDNLFDYFFYNAVPPSIVCTAKSILDNHRFDDRVIVSEDTKMWVELMMDNPNVVINDNVGVRFLFHESNTINVVKRNVYEERKNTLKLILREGYRKSISGNIGRLAIDDCSFGIARHYFLQQQYLRACRVLLLSLMRCPTNRIKEKLYLIYNILINKRF